MRALRWLALAGLVASLPACRVKDCRDGTLLVALTLKGAAASATSLEVSVTIGGGTPITHTASTAGHDGGNLEIDFPSGYPSGKSVVVSIAALSGGTVVGSASAPAVSLDGKCERVPLTVSGGIVGGDGSVGGDGGDMVGCTPTATSCAADACGRADDGCGGFVTCATPCQLDNAAPTLANAGDTLVLDGRFSGTTTVDFPGAPGQAATLVGNLRATVAVPAAATAGDLVVHTGNSALPAVRFRAAAYPLTWKGLYERFVGDPPQGDIGRDAASMTTGRNRPAILSVNDRLIVLGGATGLDHNPSPLASIETLSVNVDGTLNPGFPVSGSLALPRFSHSAHLFGSIIHVIGGSNGSSPYAMNEQATLAADGTIGAFSIVGEPTLVTARAAHRSIAIGSTLFVLGGAGASGDLASIESAPVNADGSLGTFATATATLTQPRHDFGLFTTASAIYVVGGLNGTTALASIESAPINADGSLGTFAAVTPTLPTASAISGAIVVGHMVYVFRTAGVDSATINSDGTLGTFTTVQSTAFGVGAVAVARDEIILAGGSTSDGAFSYLLSRALFNGSGALGTFALDPINKLAEERNFSVVVPAPDSVYLIGGAVASGAPVATIEQVVFNPDDSFKSVSVLTSPTLTTARRAAAAAIKGHLLYVAGGQSTTTNSLASVETAGVAPDGSLTTFTAATATLATARYSHRMSSSFGGLVCAIGGLNYPAGANFPTSLSSVECFNGTAWTASASGPLKVARDGFGLVAAGANYYAIGGNAITSIDMISTGILDDGGTGAWATSTLTTPTQDRDFSVLTVGPYTYLLGSSSSIGGIKTITRSQLGAATPASFATYTGGSLQIIRVAPAGVVVGNRAYVLGGDSSGTIESAPLQ